MIEHGISTSKADFWLHLHPFDCAIWFYRRERCLKWIDQEKPQLIGGRSKGPGTPITGAGYLLPKSALWIGFIAVDPRFFRWRNEKLTDREWGMRGQRIFELLVAYGAVRLPERCRLQLAAKEQQLVMDYVLEGAATTSYELKTERQQTTNLFVQFGEGGHQVHYTADGEFKFSELA